MPRRPRSRNSGLVFHVLNRAAKRARLFDGAADYEAFERVLSTALDRGDVALFAYCIMPNHWHLLLSAAREDGVSRFMHWLTTTHARRWQIYRELEGQGAVYQGRFKAIAVNSDHHFLCVCRYIERNPLRASLVDRAQDWRWCSLHRRHTESECPHIKLAKWPVECPDNWIDLVNAPQTESEVQAIREAIRSGRPFGDESWTAQTIKLLGLSTRKAGRPQGAGTGSGVIFRSDASGK